MPLTESCSLQAYDQNIRSEIRAGKPPEQAAAIARDVLARACERAGKPVPERVSKGSGEKAPKVSRKKTREYLEAALTHARKMLPGWMFAIIHQAAMPSAGGKARANRRLEAMEKAWIEKASCVGMGNAELKDAFYKASVSYAAAKRQGKDTKGLVGRGAEMVKEMKKRGLATSGALAKACAEKTKKGFLFGNAEGGVHAHAINRTDGKTGADGAHMHVFVLPGEGTLIYSAEDGAHEHELGPAMTKNDGKHSHRVYLPTGREVETSIDGKHVHDLMLETTTLCGSHQHTFALRDGTEVTSLTVAEYVDKFGSPEGPPGLLPPASVIVNALNQSRMLAAELEMARMAPIPEAVEMAVKGEQLPVVPEAWEVVDIEGTRATVELEGGTRQEVAVAGDVEVGDVVDVADACMVGFSDSVVPDDEEAVVLKRIYADEVKKATTVVPFHGPQDARVVFVGSAPSEVEFARREPLVGPDAVVFEELYLAPLGLTRKDVGIGLACPACAPEGASHELWRPWLDTALEQCNGALVVALGRVAKEALGDRAAFTLPHPSAVRRFGHSGEVTRKVRAMAKALDIPMQTVKARKATRPTGRPSKGDFGATLAEPRSELRKGDAIRCRVVKSAPEKQIVYGVVLDPYSVDLQNEWVPPATIEDSAHDFVEKSRVIGLKHVAKADARLVESWVELYPSVKDREAALGNLPHRVFRRRFGDDVIHSGSWLAGVRLSDELWNQYQKGEIDAFSVGGFSFKTKVSTSAMPDVEFVDLAPSA